MLDLLILPLLIDIFTPKLDIIMIYLFSQCLFHCLNETVFHLSPHIFKTQFYFFSSDLHVCEHGLLV